MVNYQLFERFIFKKLSATDELAFKKRLQEDPDFKVEFENHKKLQQSFDLLLEDDILNVINQNKNQNEVALKPKSVQRLVLRCAAFFAILVCALLFMNPSPNALEIVTEAKGFIAKKERGTNQNKDISKVKIKLNSIHQMFEPPSTKIKMENIISTISKIDKSKLSIKDRQMLDWWMALAQVGIDKEKGKEFVVEIAEEHSHLYSDRAKNVLDQYSFFKRLLSKFSSY